MLLPIDMAGKGGNHLLQTILYCWQPQMTRKMQLKQFVCSSSEAQQMAADLAQSCHAAGLGAGVGVRPMNTGNMILHLLLFVLHGRR